MQRVKAGKFSFDDKAWAKISQGAKSFICRLLTHKQEDRPSAEECLKDPWITDHSQITVDEGVALGALSNLKEFRADQTLKRATFAFIASQLLKKDEKAHLARVFQSFDKDGNGKLDKEEVKNGYLEHYGQAMSDEEVDQMFKQVDIDNSGFIDYGEFVVAAMNEKSLTSNDRLQAAFKMFDKDDSGVISPDEIKEVLTFGGASDLDSAALDAIIK